VISGDYNTTTAVSGGSNPVAVAVNPVTNKIYVANQNLSSNSVTVIDGRTIRRKPSRLAHLLARRGHPVTNKIYVANYNNIPGGSNTGTVTVINGSNNTTQTVTAGSTPIDVAVNPVTNKIYVANCGSSCNGMGPRV